MRILHFSTYDIRGGAAQAAFDLHRNLRETGHASRMVVRHKNSMDPDVLEVRTTRWRWRCERLRKCAQKIWRNEKSTAGLFNFDDSILFGPVQLCCVPKGAIDVVCVHLCDELLTTRGMHGVGEYYGVPLVITLMDQEPITGGCHYSMGCNGYTRCCGNCPQLEPSCPRDASRRVWERKKRCLSGLSVTVRTGSRTSAGRVRDSSLFRDKPVRVLPGPINEEVFRPFDKMVARDLLGVPQDKTVVVFGASMLDDPRKGMHLFHESLGILNDMLARRGANGKVRGICLLGVGHGGRDIGAGLPFQRVFLEPFKDELALALVYQAGDVFVNASLQDEGPVMLAQAMMCGLPPVSFRTDLAVDILVTGQNGFLCERNSAEELSRGLSYALDCPEWDKMREQCHTDALSVFDRGRFMQSFVALCESAIHGAKKA